LRVPAQEALAQVGLEGRADALASNLSHGEHRQLEIAMALATRPKMLLLDEPLAGMGSNESRRMVAMLQELKRRLTILLVEHDLEGRLIASGVPPEIRTNAEVRTAYLGEESIAPARGSNGRRSEGCFNLAVPSPGGAPAAPPASRCSCVR
jgi:branched-chain amino acid transport system ATP-binding protein